MSCCKCTHVLRSLKGVPKCKTSTRLYSTFAVRSRQNVLKRASFKRHTKHTKLVTPVVPWFTSAKPEAHWCDCIAIINNGSQRSLQLCQKDRYEHTLCSCLKSIQLFTHRSEHWSLSSMDKHKASDQRCGSQLVTIT